MNEDKVCFLSLDFETGGLLPLKSRFKDRFDNHPPGSPILSYGAILLDDNLNYIGHRAELVQPRTHDSEGNPMVITAEALAVNKLDPDYCKRRGDTVLEMCEQLNDLCALSGDSPIVLTGSNPGFDKDFWEEASRQCGIRVPKELRRRMLDTYELNVEYLIHKGYSMRAATDNGSLPKFMKIVGMEHQAHDALGDTVAVWKCLLLHLKNMNRDLIEPTVNKVFPNANPGTGTGNDRVGA